MFGFDRWVAFSRRLVLALVCAKWYYRGSTLVGTVLSLVCSKNTSQILSFHPRSQSSNRCSTVAIFNVLACIGWSAVNVIVGAQLFNAVGAADGVPVPGWAGIIIIAAATFFLTCFGYKVVRKLTLYSLSSFQY